MCTLQPGVTADLSMITTPLQTIIGICAGLILSWGGYLWVSGGENSARVRSGKAFVLWGIMLAVIGLWVSGLSGLLLRPKGQESVDPSTFVLWIALGAMTLIAIGIVVLRSRRARRLPTTDADSHTPALSQEPTLAVLPEPGLDSPLALTEERRGHLLDDAWLELSQRPEQLYRAGQAETGDYERWANALNTAKQETDNDTLFEQAKHLQDLFALGAVDETQFNEELGQLLAEKQEVMRQRALTLLQMQPLEGQT